MGRMWGRVLAMAIAATFAASFMAAPARAVVGPPNDAFAGATTVSPLPYYQTLDTTTATSEGVDAEAAALCTIPSTAATVWYAFTAPEARGYQVDVTNSSYAAGIVVVTGDPGSLKLVACREKSVAFDGDGGTTYKILVYGTAPGGGALHLAVGFAPPWVDDQIQAAVNTMIPVQPTTGSAYQGAAQTVKAAVTGRLVEVSLPLARASWTSKELVLEIHAGAPTGTLLAKSDPVPPADIPVGAYQGAPTNAAWTDFYFAEPPTIAAGETFAIVIPPAPLYPGSDPAWGWGKGGAVYAGGTAWVGNANGPLYWGPYADDSDFAFDTVVEPLGWPRALRYWGMDRFGTAADTSYNTFSPGVDIVYLANAFDFPDALAGAAAAGTVKGPVLLVGKDLPLDPDTLAELKGLKPKKVAILGGTGVVSDAVKTEVAKYAGAGGVVRYAGATRFTTAVAISQATFPAAGSADVAYVAYAFDFPDALAGAAAAGTVKGPILLAATNGPLDVATRGELLRLQPKKIIVLGGTGVISAAVYTELAGLGFSHTMARYAGPNRFATAAAISANTFPAAGTVPAAYIAYAFDFPDALAGAAAAGTVPGPVLLAAKGTPVDANTTTELGRLKPKRIIALGGTGVISDAVVTALAPYATGP